MFGMFASHSLLLKFVFFRCSEVRLSIIDNIGRRETGQWH